MILTLSTRQFSREGRLKGTVDALPMVQTLLNQLIAIPTYRLKKIDDHSDSFVYLVKQNVLSRE